MNNTYCLNVYFLLFMGIFNYLWNCPTMVCNIMQQVPLEIIFERYSMQSVW